MGCQNEIGREGESRIRSVDTSVPDDEFQELGLQGLCSVRDGLGLKFGPLKLHPALISYKPILGGGGPK